ncbi:MAG: GAF domain-containing protein [Anaerolineales bacterium]
MRNRLRTILTVREFESEEKTRLARQLNGIFLVTILAFVSLVVSFVLLGYPLSTPGYWIFSGLALFILALLGWMRRGHLRSSAIVFLTICYLGFTYVAWIEAGVRDTAFIGLTALILLASVFLGARGTIVMSVISALTGWGLAYAEINGLIAATPDAPINTAVYMTVVFLTVGLFAYLSVHNLNRSLERAARSEASLKASNEELNTLRVNLEQQVRERTAELEKTSQFSQRRARQFQAVAEIARAATAQRDPAALLSEATRLISEQFGHYHTAIFLLDESGLTASLQAASSPEGQKMLAENFRINIADADLVGLVIASGQPRLASSADFDYPDLPRTRSEAVLPLRAGNRVIGALDIQNEAPDAFPAEDIEVLTILADQIAIAIESARLLSETAQALNEARTVYGQSLRQGWAQIPQQMRLAGFLYRGGEPNPLEKPLDLPEIQTALQSGTPVTQETSGSVFAVPLKLRDQIIGVLDVRSREPGRKFSESQLTLIRAVAERVALALENARLFEETTRRAERERTVSEISTKIRTTSDPQTMLEMALEELKRALGASEVIVRPYQPPLSPPSTAPAQKKAAARQSGKK